MTEQDLTTLLRHEVSGEPTYGGDAASVVSQGRRAVRRGRLVSASGGVVGLALASAVGWSLLSGDDARPDRGIDAAIARNVEAYDVTTMPRTMEDRTRPVLDASVPDLGPADFVAFDSQYQKLPERYWDKASGLTVRYGSDTPHRISIAIEHARGLAEGNADRYCDGGYYLECTVERTVEGDVVITTLGAQRLERAAGSGLQSWNDQYMAVTDEELGSANPDRLWFARTVKVIKSETFVTYVSEIVQAPDLTTAQTRFLVPPDDLEAIGLDPALVMPTPPPGENGCPQWTMPTMDVSCS